MSVGFNEIENGFPWGGHVDAGDSCFYCGNKLTYPVIGWMGMGSDLVLHHQCALSLCIRLIRDVHEAECKVGGFKSLKPSYLQLAKTALGKWRRGES